MDDNPPSYESLSGVQNSTVQSYRSYKYSNLVNEKEVKFNQIRPPQFIPNIPEVITHLKLLKVFGQYKRLILHEYKDAIDFRKAEKRWTLFLMVAVRRFIIFVSALKLRASKYKKAPRDYETTIDGGSREFTVMANQLVPPLDVLMVWHSFILNPMTFYDVFVRNDMYYFINYPFPLHIIDSYIDSNSFEYIVPIEFKKNYVDLLSEFTNNESDLYYDIDPDTFYHQKITIYCPYTGKAITEDVALTSPDNRGYGDIGFMTANDSYKYKSLHHWYGGPSIISHDELRIMKLDYDVQHSAGLEGIFKYYSKIMTSPRYNGRNPQRISDEISKSVIAEAQECFKFKSLNDDVKHGFPTLKDILSRVNSKNQKRRTTERLILERYMKFNLICFTIPNSINIGEDLVGCVLRQEKFVEKINDLDWVNFPDIKELLVDVMAKYHRFFSIITAKSLKQMLVPTLDIDLIWHTHQLMLYGYIRDCKYSECQTMIDHNDDVSETLLIDAFQYTARLYKDKYKKDYSACSCEYCTIKKPKSTFKLLEYFKLGNNIEEVEKNNEIDDATHTSDHCSGEILVSCVASAGQCCSMIRNPSPTGLTIGSSYIGINHDKSPTAKK